MIGNGNVAKSVTFSSRLQSDIFTVLEKEALSKNISMNSLVNNVLGKYTSLDRYSKDIEVVSLTKRVVKHIFNNMNDKHVEQLANEVGGVVHKELIFLKFDELTFENLIHVMIVNATRYGSVKYHSENSKHSIFIHHGVCLQFSKFLALVHEITSNNLSINMKVTNIDNDTISIELIEP